jgi:hypothetical protein
MNYKLIFRTELMFLPNWSGLPANQVELEYQNYFYVYESKFAIHYSAIITICCYVTSNFKICERGIFFLSTPNLTLIITSRAYLQLLNPITSLENYSDEEIAKYTKVLLVCNAENYSAWNARRKLLMKGFIEKENEITFLNLLTTKFPKSSSLWAYR